MLVSVIIPTKDRPQFINEAVQSVLNQTMQDFEIVIVNDGSGPVELNIQNDKIRILENEGSGQSAARNTGIKHARGKYISYLDDDDIYHNNHLQLLSSFLEENPDFGFVYSDAYRVHQELEDGKYVAKKFDRPYSQDFNLDKLLVDNFIPTLTIMHKKECIYKVGVMDTTMDKLEDWDLWIRITREFKAFHLPEVTCSFSWRTDGSTQTSKELYRFWMYTPIVYCRNKDISNDRIKQQQKKTIEIIWNNLISLHIDLFETIKEDTFEALLELYTMYGEFEIVKQIVSLIKRINPDNEKVREVEKAFENFTSIIILTLNQLIYTKLCLKSITEYTDGLYELIIVDNGSTDGTVEFLKHYAGMNGNVTVVLNNANIGFAEGNNKGISISRGKYVVLLNNDTVVSPGWLNKMIETAQDEKVGIVGPVSNSVGSKLQKIKEVGYNQDSLSGYNDFLSSWDNKEIIDTGKIIGFCMLVKKELINKIGGLDNRFGIGNFEDDDFCLRAKLSNYQAVINKNIFIHHFGSRTFKGENIDYSKLMVNNWNVFRNKWGINEEKASLDLDYNVSNPNLICPLYDINLTHTNKIWIDKNQAKQIQNNNTTKGAVELCEKASSLLLDGKLKKAEYFAEKAYKLDKNNPDIINIYSRVLSKLKQQKKAYNIIKEYMKTNPNDRYFSDRLEVLKNYAA